MSKIRILALPSAIEDIKQVAKFYNTKQNGLGKKFIQRIRDAKKTLASNTTFIEREHGYNTMPIPPFPFLIHYKKLPNSSTIAIVAVLSTYQNTDKYPS